MSGTFDRLARALFDMSMAKVRPELEGTPVAEFMVWNWDDTDAEVKSHWASMVRAVARLGPDATADQMVREIHWSSLATYAPASSVRVLRECIETNTDPLQMETDEYRASIAECAEFLAKELQEFWRFETVPARP
jgi:hypothetical protein